MALFPDVRFYDENGHLFPYDVRFDPTNRAHCEPLGNGRVRLRIDAEPQFTEANVVLEDGGGIPMTRWGDSSRFGHWEAEVRPDTNPFRYTFALRSGLGRAVYLVPAGIGNAVERLDRFELNLDRIGAHDVPDWARGAVIYQIFPDRFANGDPDLNPDELDPWGSPPHWMRYQGGDLPGIAERAGYLAELGVDAVYLNPIFEAPSTHKYDAVDYYRVDPAFGGDGAFRALIETMHRHGIRVVLDASFNHCHPRFFAFADVVEKGPDSGYQDWFLVDGGWPRVETRPHLIEDGGWGDPAVYAGYLKRLEGGTNIPTVQMTDDGPVVDTTYEAWYGVPTLPRINLANPEARRYFLDVAGYWLREFDLDGWRMDVARYVDFDFWPEFRAAARAAKPDAYLLAEIMGDASPWLQGDRFDATMNYTFRDLAVDYFATRSIDTATFLDGYVRMLAQYSLAATEVSQNLLSSHDTERILHMAGEDASRLAPAFLLQLTVPGAAGIYYGDEVGMTGGKDPGSRGAFPWHEPDSWNQELLSLVRAVAPLRKRHPALRVGDWRLAWQGEEAFAFVRTAGDDRLLVVVNRGPALDEVQIAVDGARPKVLWGEATATATAGSITLRGIQNRSGTILQM